MLAYHEQNCAIVAVKADALKQYVDKMHAKKALWSSIHVPYEHLADIFVQG